jgi:hypothetical protein
MAKLGRFVIGVIFIILAFWLMNIFNDAYNRWIMIMLEGNTELWVDNLILLVIDAVFFGINSWLLRDFVEAE